MRLPLAEWDNLFYALQAEVRQIYTSLQQDVGFDLDAGRKILHCAGPSGTSTNQPYSVLDMASLLEEMWFLLNDQHLIAGLDKAIRIRTIRAAASEKFVSDEDPFLINLIAAVGPDDGLYNTHTASPQNITLMLFAKINAQFHLEMYGTPPAGEKQKLLAAARSEARSKARTARQAKKMAQDSTACLCQDTCHCRVETTCRLQSGECPCAFVRGEIGELIGFQREVKSNVQKDAASAGILTATATTFLGADSNEEARMQVAGLATTDPFIVHMCRVNANEAAKRDDHIYALHKVRPRTSTNDLDLAYVPGPKTPGRCTKDPFPLGLYSNSPGRYPKIDHAQKQFIALPQRKPVPPPSFTPRVLTYGEDQAPSLPYNQAASLSSAAQVTYPAIPASKSLGRLYQTTSEPTYDSRHDLNVNVPASEYTDLAGLARRQVNPFDDVHEHPFVQSSSPDSFAPASEQNFQYSQHSSEPSPLHSWPFSEVEPRSHPLVTHEQSRSEDYTQKPHPPLPFNAAPHPTRLPLPGFIAPHPIGKQRYVRAGGNAKLSERPEIVGPPTLFDTPPTGGSTMSQAALFERLNDQDFAQQCLQDSRMAAEQRSSPPRARGEKRERQDSTGSMGRGRMAKLKRVFSRSSGGSP